MWRNEQSSAGTAVCAIELLEALAWLGVCKWMSPCLGLQDFKEQVRAVILAYGDRLQERTQHHMGCEGSLSWTQHAPDCLLAKHDDDAVPAGCPRLYEGMTLLSHQFP